MRLLRAVIDLLDYSLVTSKRGENRKTGAGLPKQLTIGCFVVKRKDMHRRETQALTWFGGSPRLGVGLYLPVCRGFLNCRGEVLNCRNSLVPQVCDYALSFAHQRDAFSAIAIGARSDLNIDRNTLWYRSSWNIPDRFPRPRCSLLCHDLSALQWACSHPTLLLSYNATLRFRSRAPLLRSRHA